MEICNLFIHVKITLKKESKEIKMLLLQKNKRLQQMSKGALQYNNCDWSS